MHCEYCDEVLHDPAAVRRHILTIGHIRNKQSYDLNKEKFLEKRRQAILHPKNFQELALLLNMHSAQDVVALDESGFFKMTSQWHCKVAEELIRVLQDSAIGSHMSDLPLEVRQALEQAIEKKKRGD